MISLHKFIAMLSFATIVTVVHVGDCFSMSRFSADREQEIASRKLVLSNIELAQKITKKLKELVKGIAKLPEQEKEKQVADLIDLVFEFTSLRERDSRPVQMCKENISKTIKEQYNDEKGLFVVVHDNLETFMEQQFLIHVKFREDEEFQKIGEHFGNELMFSDADELALQEIQSLIQDKLSERFGKKTAKKSKERSRKASAAEELSSKKDKRTKK